MLEVGVITPESMLVQLKVEPSSNARGWGDHSIQAWYTILFSGAFGCVLSFLYKVALLT
jgi:hypothetical protein